MLIKSMGGTQTISQIKKICTSKGAAIFETGIVNWSSKKREAQTFDVVDRLGRL